MPPASNRLIHEKCWIFLSSKEECFKVVVLEAMSCGCSQIATTLARHHEEEFHVKKTLKDGLK
jgi:hypothetical protein